MMMAAEMRWRAGRFLLGGREIIRTGDDDGLAVAEAPAAGSTPSSSAAAAAAARVTPAVLFITVVLAVVLLASGLLHVLRRLFLKSHRANASAEAVERQLQQLFSLHEDGAGAGPGLDQAAIDALPAFTYGELLAGAAAKAGGGGGKRQFDCAVCLCEFDGGDRLRLLPLCGHAFHAACIDTWLRSSSTCPLCRAALSARALAALAAAAADTSAAQQTDVEDQKLEQQEEAAASDEAASSVVLSVRLGRFKNTQRSDAAAAGGDDGDGSRCIDARRCYSMGSYQYVLADDNLLISVHWRPGDGIIAAAAAGANVATARTGIKHAGGGKKVFARGDSFSMSKIWQWRGGDRRLPVLHSDASPPAYDGLPWATAASTRTRHESDT